MQDTPNRLAVNLVTRRKVAEYDGRETAGFTYNGVDAGYYDPSRTFTPRNLVGQAIGERGLYLEARYAHDIIGSVMSARRNVVANLEYEIVPRSDNPTTDEIFACEAVKLMFEKMPYTSLNSWLADAYDNMHTFGFALYEIYVPTEGTYANIPRFIPVAPYQVEYFDLDENADKLKAVHVITNTGVRTVPAEKFLWFGQKAFTGNYWGVSDLRKIVALFSAYKEDLINYLQLRRQQAGIFYFDEQEEGATAEDWEIASQFLQQYYAGYSTPLIASKGMKPEFLSAQQPGIDSYDKMLSYFDTKIKQALDSTLTTLGLSGVGSLALGQEFAVDDAIKFENHIRSFLHLMNGDTCPESNAMQLLTMFAGCHPSSAPKIKLIDAVADQKNENIPVVLDMLKSEIITREELGNDNMRRILEDLGYDGDYFVKEEVYETALAETTFAVESRYEHINFNPPQGVREAATRALQMRREQPESRRGGTAVGVSRARDLSNGVAMTPDTIRRMVSYFARHEVDLQAEGANRGEKGYPSRGRQAWELWGGDAGRRWANKIKGQMDAADKNELQEIVKTKPSERIEGSKKNPEGTASGQRGGIEISEEVEKSLQNKIADWREENGDRPVQPTMGMLKAVYRRGAGAYSSTHRRGQSRASWAMSRVNRFLDMLRNPDSVKKGYIKADRDILTDEQQEKLRI
jgi:hypothetical protein